MFEGEGEAVVYSSQLDDGILYYHPVRVLQRERHRLNIRTYLNSHGVKINV